MRIVPRRPAFSLLELMIAIVILGLGLVMVATIFPVAWTRAREMTEYTVQRTAFANAHETISTTLRVPGPGFIESVVSGDGRHRASFAGDGIPDPFAPKKFLNPPNSGFLPMNRDVYALHLENSLVAGQGQSREFVREDPWEIEHSSLAKILTPLLCSDWNEEYCNRLIEQSYHNKQMRFHERFYPPLPPLKENPTMQEVNRWEEALDTRRYAWAVLHRLRNQVSDANASRAFDVYYVLLRRTQPTHRFARQDPTSAPLRFDPGATDVTLVTPSPARPEDDVLLPTAWRVQVEFSSKPQDKPQRKADATGVPTEIEVPPAGTPGNVPTIAAMFQPGTQFVDELNGQVYRVLRRRPVPDDEDRAILALGREVFVEDLELNCVACVFGDADLHRLERIRTVWIFPPPVAPRQSAGDSLDFVGPQPVVHIEVRGLTLSPTR